LSGIIKTKIYSIILGTVGIGIVAQVLNLNGMISSLGSVGIPLGLTKYVSIWESEKNWKAIREAIAKFMAILLIFGVILTILTIIFSQKISNLILDSDSYSLLIIIVAFSFPFSLIYTIFESTVRGLKQFSQYAKLTVLVSSLTVIISVIFVYSFRELGVVLAIVLSALVNTIIFTYYFHKKNIFTFRDLKFTNYSITPELKKIFAIGLAGLTDLFFTQLVLISIRSIIVRYLGIETNGIYQTIYVISSNYLMIFFMSIAAYSLPVLSELNDVSKINIQINDIFKLTLLLVFPIISITYVFRDYLILLFFSSKFSSASNFFIYNFVGDFFKSLSWVLGAWLIPRSKLRLWVTLAVVYSILYFLAFFVLIKFVFLDLKSVVIAYAFVNIFHFAINYYFIRKLQFFRFNKDVIKILSISMICLLTLFFASFINVLYGYVLILPVIAIWVKFCIRKEEALKLIKIFKNKIYPQKVI